MRLMVVDIENVLVEFHHTPTASEGECRWRLLRELRSDFGDEVQRLTLTSSRIHQWVSRSNAKLVLQTRDDSYVAGAHLNYGPVFVHVLFGGDHLSGGACEMEYPSWFACLGITAYE
jgi:hypothetical protein